jgi:hypothetical protein
MADDLDAETKLKIYTLILSRYKDLINQNESRSISEIRQKVSPYNEYMRKLRDRLLYDLSPYEPDRLFLSAAERSVSYIRGIRTCEFAFNFWMDFEEVESLKIASAMDKGMLLVALLRSIGSEDARVLVTKKGKVFVRYGWKGITYLFNPQTDSLSSGGDSLGFFTDDPLAYSFNDLAYENFEED